MAGGAFQNQSSSICVWAHAVLLAPTPGRIWASTGWRCWRTRRNRRGRRAGPARSSSPTAPASGMTAGRVLRVWRGTGGFGHTRGRVRPCGAASGGDWSSVSPRAAGAGASSRAARCKRHACWTASWHAQKARAARTRRRATTSPARRVSSWTCSPPLPLTSPRPQVRGGEGVGRSAGESGNGACRQRA